MPAPIGHTTPCPHCYLAAWECLPITYRTLMKLLRARVLPRDTIAWHMGRTTPPRGFGPATTAEIYEALQFGEPENAPGFPKSGGRAHDAAPTTESRTTNP